MNKKPAGAKPASAKPAGTKPPNTKPASTRDKGYAGESEAARELESRNIRIIRRNYNTPSGEVDLIGLEDGAILFIEVKSWSAFTIDNLQYSINKTKQRRIIESARNFLREHPEYSELAVRFDVVFIGPGRFKFIRNAFTE